MELVYLWVEDYKNIKRQGFNFSPRSRCEYDEETNELEVIDKEITKEPYLKNFYGENINITAIVGENGSGKSSIIESFQLLFQFLIKQEIYKYTSPINQFLNAKPKYKSDYIILFANKYNEIFIDTNVPIRNKLSTYSFFQKSFYFSMSNDISKSFGLSQGIYHENSYIFTKPNRNESVIDLRYEYKQCIKNILYLINDKKTPFDTNFFTPHRCFISYHDQQLYKPFSKESVPISSLLKSLSTEKNITQLLKLLNILYLIELTKECHEYLAGAIPLFGSNINLENLRENDIDMIVKNIDYSKFERAMSSEQKNQKGIGFSNSDEISKMNELTRTLMFFDFLDTFKDCIISCSSLEFEVDVKTLLEKDLVDKLPDYFGYDFVDKNELRFNNLSTGEQEILNIIYSIKDVIRKRENKTDYFYIVFDEVSNSLHPKWHTKLLSDLIKLLKSYRSISFHLIITTHSPFILSDIPKENVIFLEKGKQVYPFENGQTFGANIHTLLSHGFFMKDGLMGEFAKKKINTIIENLNDKNYNPVREEKEKVLCTIKTIGEEFLRTKLLDMFYKKFRDKSLKEQRKKELETQKEMIEKELENL